MTNLAENLAATAERFPDQPALRLHDTTFTFAELEQLAGRAAGRMAALGVGAGDRVGIMLPNVLEFPVLFYGALRLGAIAVPMNPLLRGREIAHYTGDSGMVLLWTHESVSPEDTAEAVAGCRVEQVGSDLLASLAGEDLPPYAPKEATDTAVVLYTSGTT